LVEVEIVFFKVEISTQKKTLVPWELNLESKNVRN
jgi:hypothetical protein